MATLEQEIIEKFHRLDKAAQQRVRMLIEQETGSDPAPTTDRQDWVDFINSTYGSLADDPLDEIDNTALLSPEINAPVL
ncbi:MAG: hypothetical protein JNL34_14530 [Anaerolineae bacterium]|nr:hypothetical protein [Anaerolineae bacterium]